MILTHFDLFSTTQLIYHVDNDSSTLLCTCNLDNLKDALIDFAKRYNNEDIHLYGNQDYAEGLKEQIENSLKTNYANTSIKVYIN